MPEGPWGGPRITSILPFSSDDVEIVFEESRKENHKPIPPEAKRLLGDLGADISSGLKVDRRVMVKQEPDKTGIGPVDEVKSFLSDLGERAAGITYYIFENDVAYIGNVWVDPRFRREGLASEIRTRAVDDMRDSGVMTVYSFPVSNAGEELAKSQGFIESEVVSGFMQKRL